MEERQPSKLDAAGSSPAGSGHFFFFTFCLFQVIYHLYFFANKQTKHFHSTIATSHITCEQQRTNVSIIFFFLLLSEKFKKYSAKKLLVRLSAWKGQMSSAVIFSFSFPLNKQTKDFWLFFEFIILFIHQLINY